MRRAFADELLLQMKVDPDIVVITGDLGYGMFDKIRDEVPAQFFNVGASEQAMMGVAVGMALSGKKVFVYSITPFLIYRAFETIRTYIDHEKIPICLVGSGRDDDYKHDGYSHNASDVHAILKPLKNIIQYYPTTPGDIPYLVASMVKKMIPSFISLRR